MTKITLSFSVSEEIKKMLFDFMAEDFQTNKSAFFAYLVVQEKKRRSEEGGKRPVGRPKKEEEFNEDDNTVKNPEYVWMKKDENGNYLPQHMTYGEFKKKYPDRTPEFIARTDSIN